VAGQAAKSALRPGSRTPLSLVCPPQRRAAADRLPFHHDEARQGDRILGRAGAGHGRSHGYENVSRTVGSIMS
jgi:hypothetical protein